VEQDRFQARDAHTSTVLLTLILLAHLGISLVTQRAADLGRLVETLRGAQVVTAFAGLAVLLRARRQPREGVALAIWLLLVVPTLPIGLVTAMRWHQLGRPWEAFPALHLALISLALITPRSFWLGVGFVAAFTAETLGVALWLRRVDPVRFPRLEPMATVLVGCVSMGLLWMRAQRRRTTLRYLDVEGEMAMLAHLTEKLRETRARLESSGRVLMSALAELSRGGAAEPLLDRVRQAVARLQSVDARLAALETAPRGTNGEAASAEVAARAGEQQFRARDTHDSVMLFAVLLGTACTTAALDMGDVSVGYGRWFYGGCGLLSALALGELARRRARPSETHATAIFLLILAPLPPLFVYTHLQWARSVVPIAMFTGPKLIMAIVPLVLPRFLWLGIAVEAVMGVLCLALYVLLDLGSQQYRLPYADPWTTLLYCAVGIGLVISREQRRTASVRLLREEVEAAARARRSAVLLAILDETGSPLQVLSLSLDMLASRGDAFGSQVPRMIEAVNHFSDARRSLMEAPLFGARSRLGFDAAQELARRT
jgi:hypothetical protein